jgi:hypothetical protein
MELAARVSRCSRSTDSGGALSAADAGTAASGSAAIAIAIAMAIVILPVRTIDSFRFGYTFADGAESVSMNRT